MLFTGEGHTIRRHDPIESLQKTIRDLNAKIKHPEKQMKKWVQERDECKARLKEYRKMKRDAAKRVYHPVPPRYGDPGC